MKSFPCKRFCVLARKKLCVTSRCQLSFSRVKGSGKYLPQEDVDFSDSKPVEKSTGHPVVVEWEKMSKSKKNGIEPSSGRKLATVQGLNETSRIKAFFPILSVLDKYGCDTVRLMILCDVAPASDRNWSEDVYPRIRNIQVRYLSYKVFPCLT